jgi:DNA recombination protein RmuC
MNNWPVGILIALVAAVSLVIGWLIGRTGGGSRTIDLSPLLNRLDALEKGNERTERAVKEEVARQREESANQARALREELGAALKNAGDSTVNTLGKIGEAQRGQLETFGGQLAKLVESNDKKLGELRTTVETKLTQIQTENATKLEEMRKTVDEKLQSTLEKRLGESFKQVSDRLEQVHKGLGEMQSLATGVGDLKRVLTNVKTRGTWGEMQLSNLLEQILTVEQYAQNVQTKHGSAERVEFAIRLPGRDEESGAVWLPIDAKFPKEDYERLVEASEKADAVAVEQASKQLELRIKAEAKDIRDKYLDPPNTTDFAILYLSTEGLYAEVMRRPGLLDTLQREYRVTVAGPTVLGALLNSLQMGFRTLAIEKRSSEVWKVLGAVKTEFGNFGNFIERVQKKLQEASNVIDDGAKRTRAVERKLRAVQGLPASEAAALVGEAEVLPVETDGPDME